MTELHFDNNNVKSERFFIKKVLDIRYRDQTNENKHKQITIDTKILPQNQHQNINQLRQIFESDVLIIYDNNMYTNKYYKNKYKTIIESNINNNNLIYVTQYCYLDSYQL